VQGAREPGTETSRARRSASERSVHSWRDAATSEYTGAASTMNKNVLLVAGEDQVHDGAVPVGSHEAGRFTPGLQTMGAGAA
jgi:hypothetical protein